VSLQCGGCAHLEAAGGVLHDVALEHGRLLAQQLGPLGGGQQAAHPVGEAGGGEEEAHRGVAVHGQERLEEHPARVKGGEQSTRLRLLANSRGLLEPTP
jgi:hypothetical protein